MSTPTPPVLDLALKLSCLRGCREPEGACAETGFPCPFCDWSLNINEYGAADAESGCITWAAHLLKAST